jgi:hypothetical protein
MTMANLRKLLPVATAVVVAMACSVIARDAHATPNFPDEIKAHLMLQASPPCAICHQGGVTGLGTVTTPFGKSMRARGLVPFDLGSLDNALDQMKSGNVSSVGDGTPDIQKLQMGIDPNARVTDGGVVEGTDAAITPLYGCGAHVAPTNDAGDAWPALSALLTLATLASWRFKSRRRRA